MDEQDSKTYGMSLCTDPCSECDGVYYHGHHPDYSRPGALAWLCEPCLRCKPQEPTIEFTEGLSERQMEILSENELS